MLQRLMDQARQFCYPLVSCRRLVVTHAACWAVLAALLAGVPAAGAAPLVVAVSRTPLSLPLFVAQENGYFKAEGLDVQLTECVGGHRCLRQVLDGQADLATSGDLPIVVNSFSNANFTVLCTFVKAHDDVKLVTHARAAIKASADLKGKRIGVVMGTAGQYFLELFLLKEGVDSHSLTLVAMQPEDMTAALQSGKVDAVSIWQPYAHLAQKALGPAGHVLPGGSAYIQTFNLVAHRKLTGTRDAELAKVLRALQRAERFILEQPAEAKGLLSRRLALDAGFVDNVWPGLSYRLGLDQSLIATMEGEARWATREGHVQGGVKPNFLQLLYPAPLRSVKPDAVTVAR